MKRILAQINDWVVMRQWNIFWLGFPALLTGAMMGLVVLMVWANSRQSNRIDFQYQRRITTALEARRFEEARVACLRELSTDMAESDRMQTVYQLALALNGLGQKGEAMALLEHAAPLDRLGSAPAHLLLAQILLNSSDLNEDKLKLAEQHFLNALARDSQSLEVNEMLGRYYINTRNLSKARARLLNIYPAKTEAALLLAITYALDNDNDSAVLWANTAISDYNLKLKNTAPDDNPMARFGLASALMMEKKYAEAVATLEQGQCLSTNSAYAIAIADDCAIWSERISRDLPEKADECLKAIQKGLKYSPQNIKLQMQLVQAAQSSNTAGQRAKIFLDELISPAKGEVAAGWYFLLGADARTRGDGVAARQYLQTAHNLVPQHPLVRNDLAMSLSTGSREDVAHALKLIQPVVEQFPTNPNFRDTRGRVLARMGRNAEAVADLELAVGKLPQSVETRLVLSKAYAALGKTQLAAEQRRLAVPANNPIP